MIRYVLGMVLCGLPIAGQAQIIGMATGQDSIQALSSADLRADLEDYAALGATWLRTDLNWSVVQARGPQSYDWSAMDRVVMAARRAGLKVLPVVSFAPQWAWSDPAKYSAPADPADYATFLTAAVARYAPMGLRAWEVWNEPNLSGPWPDPDPVAYTRLLNQAHAAIKAADPEALVIAGGLAAVPATDPARPRRHYAAVAFLEAMYRHGATFDALAFHPYSYPHMPAEDVPWSGWTMMKGPIRDLMVQNGDGQKPIWITEFGAPTNGSDTAVSEEEQAEMLDESLGLLASYPWAGPLFWYDYRDRGTDPDTAEDWFGIVTQDGRRKPAYDMFERLRSPQ